ncbi:MAG: outer membrane beta-barrel protein [Acidobacteriota bacterium]|jgi:hypothetical protein
MLKHRVITLSILCCALTLLGAPSARAQEPTPPAEPEAVPGTSTQTPQQGQSLSVPSRDHNAEASFFIGGLVGGDLASLVTDGFSLSSTLENGRTYGGRVGYYTFPLGVEGSFTYSNRGLGFTTSFERADISLGARVMYLEGNVLLILIPGPVQPFLTGGGGLQSYELVDFAGIQLQKWGWNFGGGIKFNIKRVSLRVDVRDHLTKVSAADFNIDQELADLLDIGEQSLHNAEISFGIGFRF